MYYSFVLGCLMLFGFVCVVFARCLYALQVRCCFMFACVCVLSVLKFRFITNVYVPGLLFVCFLYTCVCCVCLFVLCVVFCGFMLL